MTISIVMFGFMGIPALFIFKVKWEMGEMGKGEMGTAHAGKPPSLPRELRTPLVPFDFAFSPAGKDFRKSSINFLLDYVLLYYY
jgi:hypothetical protein